MTLFACDDREPAEVVSAEYVDEVTIKITLRVPDNPADYAVSDETLSIYSLYNNLYHRVSAVSGGNDNAYTLTLRRALVPNDRIRVNGLSPLTGSVFFDVPKE